MPEYAYQCTHCGQTQAHTASASDLPDWLTCPQCGGLAKRSAQWYHTIALQGSPLPDPQADKATLTDAPPAHVCYAGCAMHHFHPDLEPTEPQP